jgi:hypothetical protein
MFATLLPIFYNFLKIVPYKNPIIYAPYGVIKKPINNGINGFDTYFITFETDEITKDVSFLTFEPIHPNVFPTIFAVEDIIVPKTPPTTPNIPTNLAATPNGLISILENKLIFPVFLLLISHILALSFLSLTLIEF